MCTKESAWSRSLRRRLSPPFILLHIDVSLCAQETSCAKRLIYKQTWRKTSSANLVRDYLILMLWQMTQHMISMLVRKHNPCWNQFLPSPTVVGERLYFHRCLSVHGGGEVYAPRQADIRHPLRADTPPGHTPQADIPPGHIPLGQAAPCADTHPGQTATAANDRHPTGMHSYWKQCFRKEHGREATDRKEKGCFNGQTSTLLVSLCKRQNACDTTFWGPCMNNWHENGGAVSDVLGKHFYLNIVWSN